MVTITTVSCEKPSLTASEVDGVVSEIKKECSSVDNNFPEDLLEVEFQEYTMPKGSGSEIIYNVRFANISGKTIKMDILPFYDRALDDFIIGRNGSIVTSVSFVDPAEIKPNAGFIMTNVFTTLNPWDEYDEKQQKEIEQLSKQIYYKILVNDVVYYFAIDFEEQKVITNLTE